ncbi:hypothetical protein CEXT_197221 [Caerostris extrusa]|uniref:Uncharacterized protein n=1 Tax=Caerostris extrusa TaxID=172846 RepID=A0AAV4MCS0_CAEEX|nr:hypothetical protein CEXT_197221 [Caerostris extrusa]
MTKFSKHAELDQYFQYINLEFRTRILVGETHQNKHQYNSKSQMIYQSGVKKKSNLNRTGTESGGTTTKGSRPPTGSSPRFEQGLPHVRQPPKEGWGVRPVSGYE